jgi:hypothetical protein
MIAGKRVREDHRRTPTNDRFVAWTRRRTLYDGPDRATRDDLAAWAEAAGEHVEVRG